VSLALVTSPPTEQLSVFAPSDDSTVILPPKYGPVDTSTSLTSGKHRLALAETDLIHVTRQLHSIWERERFVNLQPFVGTINVFP